VAVVRTDVFEELSASISKITLMMEALSFSETSVLTTATRRNIPKDDIRHSRRRENLKSYTKCMLNIVDPRIQNQKAIF
jgi:hypothetical protein